MVGLGQDFASLFEFLAERVDLGRDPFIRTLPAQLIIQICRQAYVHWVEQGNFAVFGVSATYRHADGPQALRPLTPDAVPAVKSERNLAIAQRNGTRSRTISLRAILGRTSDLPPPSGSGVHRGIFPISPSTSVNSCSKT